MDAAAELGRNPGSKHQIQPEYGDEQADAGRDGWTRLARPNSQARTGTGECSFSLFSWPRAGLATLPGWSILCYMGWPYIHTYMQGHTKKILQKAQFVTLLGLKTGWRWDHRLQIQILFMAFKRVPRWLVTLSQQYNTGEKPTVMLYTYIINRHAGTPDKNKTKLV